MIFSAHFPPRWCACVPVPMKWCWWCRPRPCANPSGIAGIFPRAARQRCSTMTCWVTTAIRAADPVGSCRPTLKRVSTSTIGLSAAASSMCRTTARPVPNTCMLMPSGISPRCVRRSRQASSPVITRCLAGSNCLACSFPPMGSPEHPQAAISSWSRGWPKASLASRYASPVCWSTVRWYLKDRSG